MARDHPMQAMHPSSDAALAPSHAPQSPRPRSPLRVQHRPLDHAWSPINPNASCVCLVCTRHTVCRTAVPLAPAAPGRAPSCQSISAPGRSYYDALHIPYGPYSTLLVIHPPSTTTTILLSVTHGEDEKPQSPGTTLEPYRAKHRRQPSSSRAPAWSALPAPLRQYSSQHSVVGS